MKKRITSLHEKLVKPPVLLVTLSYGNDARVKIMYGKAFLCTGKVDDRYQWFFSSARYDEYHWRVQELGDLYYFHEKRAAVDFSIKSVDHSPPVKLKTPYLLRHSDETTHN